MIAPAPKVISWEEFSRISFYSLMSLKECLLKGMSNNLILAPPLPDPLPTKKLLVGRFYHELMQLMRVSETFPELERGIEDKIKNLQSTLNSYTHLKKLGSVGGWNEVNSAAQRAYNLFLNKKRASCFQGGIEKLLISSDGLLSGKPDFYFISGHEGFLTEYKSSALYDAEGFISKEHKEQLLFYSILLFDNNDITNVIGTLESISGNTHEVRISREDAEEFRQDALSRIQEANAAINKTRDVSTLANPTKEACRSCTKRIVCTKFKKEQISLGINQDAFIIEGILGEIVQPPSKGTSTLKVLDKFQGKNIEITVPDNIITLLKIGKTYLLSNLDHRNGSFSWSHSSEIYAHE